MTESQRPIVVGVRPLDINAIVRREQPGSPCAPAALDESFAALAEWQSFAASRNEAALIRVEPGRHYAVSVWPIDEADVGDELTVLIDELDGRSRESEACLLTHQLPCGAAETPAERTGVFATTSGTAALHVYLRGHSQSAWLTRLRVVQVAAPPPSVVASNGRPVAVADTEDVSAPLAPTDFWARVAPAAEDADVASRSLWASPLLRRHFCAVDVSLPSRVRAFHQGLRRARGAIGTAPDLTDPAGWHVIADDVRFAPIVRAHTARGGAYSSRYYPRRIGDWLNYGLLPALTMSDDPLIAQRARDCVDFQLYCQYDAAGGNRFTSELFADEFAAARDQGLTAQWAGGWDFLFDWRWLDGYGYQWHLHEPDHHVNALMAASMVRAYELSGVAAHLESATDFVYQQVPRYGWHTGLWRGRRYYWTEYSPSGDGHPDRDATVNIQALVAHAVAMVGHYRGDRRMLGFASGLLWYCVREWHTEGRWYYDGAENPINQRRAISHDMATLLPLLGAFPYLLRSGVPIDDEMGAVTQAYEYYLDNYDGAFDYDGLPGFATNEAAAITCGRLVTLAPERTASGAWETTSYFTANRAGRDLVVSAEVDPASGADPVSVRADLLRPPAWADDQWSTASDHAVMRDVSGAELRSGWATGIVVGPGDVVRVDCRTAPGASAPAAISSLRYDDGGGTRVVRAIAVDPDAPAAVRAADYPMAAARLCFPLGPERGNPPAADLAPNHPDFF